MWPGRSSRSWRFHGDDEEELEEDQYNEEDEEMDVDTEPEEYVAPLRGNKDLKTLIAEQFLVSEPPGSFAFGEECRDIISTPGMIYFIR
jgi:hypothetical protein